jgi:hypothetical protein
VAEEEYRIMSKPNVAALRAKLLSGQFVEADLDEAASLVKSLRDGALTKENAAEVVDGLEELTKGLLPEEPEADTDAHAAPTPPETPVAPETLPDPGALAKSLAAHPEAARAINAVPALQLVAQHYESMVELQAEQATQINELTGLVKSLSGQVLALTQAQAQELSEIKKSLAGGLTPAATPQAAENPAEATRQERMQALGQDAAEALTKALAATGIIEKIESLDQQVNHRPWSGNPPRAAGVSQPLAKSLAAGAALAAAEELTKPEAIGLIQKSLGAGRINEIEAQDALAQLDLARYAGKSFGEIVSKFDKKTLEEYQGA